MRFKTEHLPTEGKVSEGKDHQHQFCFSFQTWWGDGDMLAQNFGRKP